MNSVKIQKKDLRKTILTLLKNQKEEDRLRKSDEIKNKLWLNPDFINSKTVLFYASFQGEVETFEMIRNAMLEEKRVALPVINIQTKEIIPKLISNLEEDLEYGPYNIQQPKEKNTKSIDINEIDLVVVPALAYDYENHRLGRGAGYYDRFLKMVSSDVSLIGLAFDFQILKTLPFEEHDLSVTRVITNSL